MQTSMQHRTTLDNDKKKREEKRVETNEVLDMTAMTRNARLCSNNDERQICQYVVEWEAKMLPKMW
jgi:hypothetical protein